MTHLTCDVLSGGVVVGWATLTPAPPVEGADRPPITILVGIMSPTADYERLRPAARAMVRHMEQPPGTAANASLEDAFAAMVTGLATANLSLRLPDGRLLPTLQVIVQDYSESTDASGGPISIAAVLRDRSELHDV